MPQIIKNIANGLPIVGNLCSKSIVGPWSRYSERNLKMAARLNLLGLWRFGLRRGFEGLAGLRKIVRSQSL